MRETHQPREGTFATTQWSVILAAGSSNRDDANAALEQLCSAYWRPLFEYARRRGIGVEDAADWTQAFFADLLTRGTVQRADAQRGRFRTFLLTAFQRFLSNERDRSTALKRGGSRSIISIDQLQGESAVALHPADYETPEAAFERSWATTLLARVLDLLRTQMIERGRGEVFDRCRDCLLGAPVDSCASIAASMGLTESAIKVAIHRMRQEYRDLLFREVRQTLSDESELEDEMRHLLSVVQSSR
ncbi:MAG: RNA polymerase sigma factor [Planctomycetota bacterium]